MAWTPSRIVLISYGRHDEAPADADCYPGMLLAQKSNGNVIPHNVVGGGGPLLIATEEALRGLDITQKLPSGDATSFYRPTRGDEFLMLLQNGQNVAAAVALMSAGDGTVIQNLGAVLANIVAPSAVITNVGTETAFSNGTYAIPANYLQVGDVITIHSKAFCIAENSTNTHRVRAYIGSTTLADSTALQLAAGDIVEFDILMTVRTITASGTIIAEAQISYSVAGSFTETTNTLASTTLDSTVAQTIAIKSLASAANAGNQIRLDEFRVSINRATGLNTVVYSAEAINNGSGTGTSPISGFNSAAFIRVYIP